MSNETLFPDNVISIKQAHNSRNAKSKRQSCAHKNILVDERLSELECADCGSLLNPIKWLLNMTHEFRRMDESYAKLNTLREQIDERSRTKCQHCNRITIIRGLK